MNILNAFIAINGLFIVRTPFIAQKQHPMKVKTRSRKLEYPPDLTIVATMINRLAIQPVVSVKLGDLIFNFIITYQYIMHMSDVLALAVLVKANAGAGEAFFR